ncbi:MAG: hypothetical protein ACE5EG_07605 [Thermoanaerobaculia bacterium]
MARNQASMVRRQRERIRQQKRREKQAKRAARRELKKEEAESAVAVESDDPMDDPTIDWGASQAVDPAELDEEFPY